MDTPVTATTLKHDIVPAHLAVQAMRDNGYKNAAYAIAELIDNSIQAGATRVELLCGERTEFVSERQRRRIQEVAVLDNGSGMDAAVLRMALQFGNGTHLTPNGQDGIGKFGMGLPSSSISQSRRVDVWSWQNGPENALYSYLDLDDIIGRVQGEVPEPKPKPVPESWRKVGHAFGESGTLVVWSNLDRVMWKTAGSIIRNSEFLIGRMYRRFLDGNHIRIRMLAFDLGHPDRGPAESYARPNDPLYLMADTSCPEPYENEPMFEQWQEPATVSVVHRGEIHNVTIRFSHASEAARKPPTPGGNAGSLPHGKHAANNQGVSVVRAGRELELNESWVNSDPRERWWGAEVDFPPALDEVFGVSNNKQSARNFYRIDVDSLLRDGETVGALKERLLEEEDPAGPLLEISHIIDRTLGVLRRLIDVQNKGQQRSEQRHESNLAEDRATAITRQRQEDGFTGLGDEDELRPKSERREELRTAFVDSGVSAAVAENLADDIVEKGLKYKLLEAALESPAFFTLEPRVGAVLVKLNTRHPAYPRFVEVLEAEVDDVGQEELRERLRNARDSFRLLLFAWARYENELPDARRELAQEARYDWALREVIPS